MEKRSAKIKWELVWSMVGGKYRPLPGYFLSRKNARSQSIWTRVKDKHTEWGGKFLAWKI